MMPLLPQFENSVDFLLIYTHRMWTISGKDDRSVILGRIIPLTEQTNVWKHLVRVAMTVTVDFQQNSHRDVQEEKNARIDVHWPVMLHVEGDVKRRTVSRLYYILQAKESKAENKK